MTREELQATVDKWIVTLGDDMAKAKGAEEKKFASFMIMGMQLVGGLLIDVKRIADSLEQQRPLGPQEGRAVVQR